MAERRKAGRSRVLKSAKLVLGRSAIIDCVVRNLTNKGARVQIANMVELPKDFEAGAARWRAFLDGYLSEAVLTYQECAAMPELYWASRVHSLWVYEEHYRQAPKGREARTDRVAMEDIAGLEWWLRRRTDLALALADALRAAPRARVRTHRDA